MATLKQRFCGAFRGHSSLLIKAWMASDGAEKPTHVALKCSKCGYTTKWFSVNDCGVSTKPSHSGKNTIEKVVSDLKEMFPIMKGDRISESEERTIFYCHKQNRTSEKVTSNLIEYFDGVVIDGGACELSPITMIWTTFEVRKL